MRQARHVGMHLYMGLGYRSRRWYTDDGKEVKCAWDEEAGLRPWSAPSATSLTCACKMHVCRHAVLLH